MNLMLLQTPCFWPSMCVEPENTDYGWYNLPTLSYTLAK